MSEVIDAMGIASAKAQGLRTPITSADRLRNSDYILYVLFDPEGNM
jgi:alpha-tubulin N-acetyltransferase 1